jgi:Zn-dependent metalloprotease
MRPVIKSVLAVAVGLGIANAHAVEGPAVARALSLLGSHGEAVKESARDGFRARDVIVDADGTEHVRFDRTYAGLPVIGGDVVVHSRGATLRPASSTLAARIDVSTRPTLSRADAIVAAGAQFGADFDGMPDATLVVYARGRAPARLAWQVRLQNADAEMTYIVGAHDGRLLDRWSNRQDLAANGTAKTLYSGQVAFATNSTATGFEMRDPTRGGAYTIDASNSRTSGQVYTDADNAWGNYATTDKATTAADAHYGAAVTWDYFKNIHGRLGIGNDGRGAYSRVHYGFHYSNAYWSDSCFCMTYGDGDGVSLSPLVALDIASHEMSHGVAARTAGLIYSGESGGLNEANSDILSSMVEFYANNPSDTPDYLVGEEVYMGNVAGSANQRALRYMFNPIADGRSPNCDVATLGNLDVHYSSGVANRFFYLLAEGSGAHVYSGVNHAAPTCNGAVVTGVGRAKAQKIWYRALSIYFTSDTNYAGARAATVRAASDLYGATSAEVRAVAAAWSAVAVN